MEESIEAVKRHHEFKDKEIKNKLKHYKLTQPPTIYQFDIQGMLSNLAIPFIPLMLTWNILVYPQNEAKKVKHDLLSYLLFDMHIKIFENFFPEKYQRYRQEIINIPREQIVDIVYFIKNIFLIDKINSILSNSEYHSDFSTLRTFDRNRINHPNTMVSLGNALLDAYRLKVIELSTQEREDLLDLNNPNRHSHPRIIKHHVKKLFPQEYNHNVKREMYDSNPASVFYVLKTLYMEMCHQINITPSFSLSEPAQRNISPRNSM